MAVWQPNDTIVVGGFTLAGANPYEFAVVRFTATGELDSSFDVDGKATANFNPGSFSPDQADAMDLQQSDGTIVLAGTTYNPTTGPQLAVARFTATGALDGTFVDPETFGTPVAEPGGRKTDYFDVTGVAVQGDRKIVVAGTRSIYHEIDDGLGSYIPAGSENHFAVERFTDIGERGSTLAMTAWRRPIWAPSTTVPLASRCRRTARSWWPATPS